MSADNDFHPYRCELCGDRVDPLADGTWRKVTGWVEQRRGGGANAISEPSAPHAYRCRSCMFDRKLGIVKTQQGSMF